MAYWHMPCVLGVNINKQAKVISISVPSTPRTEGEILQSFKLMSFCFSEMKTATSNFHPVHMLSEGQTGFSYKGWIDEQSLRAAKPGTGMTIAIKKLKVYRRTLPDSKEWLVSMTSVLHAQKSQMQFLYILLDHLFVLNIDFVHLS